MATSRGRVSQGDLGAFEIGKAKFKVPPSLRLERDIKSCKLFQEMQHHMDKINSLKLSKEMTRDTFEGAAMTHEMQLLKHAEFVEKKRRQQLRQDCEELRELAEQLRLAAISKQIADDLAERERARQLAVQAKAQEVSEDRGLLEAKRREEEMARKEQQRCLRESLVSQMEENRLRRQGQHAQGMNDRELSQAKQKQIQEEDHAIQIELEQRKVQKRHDMLRSIEENKQHREWERAQNLQELGKLLEKQSEIENRKQQLEEERIQVQRKKQEISIRLGEHVQQIENQKRHRDNLLQDLLEAEYLAKSDERFRQQIQQEQMYRRRTKLEMDRYRLEQEHRKMEEMQLKRAEIETRQQEVSGTHVEAEKQLENYRQRRAHGATLLAMMEDNQRKRAEATAETVQYFDMKAKSDAELEERVKRERLLMLGQVPAPVLRYLPKHVLTSTDREHFFVSQQAMGSGDM
ncbi:meiosis-specific nuclear structural protein 1-like [Drosophila kikkawai]|uniref:Meiosis-specific nuclear structural protein 1 n=1 Tax=Drosophila kikkawai TaxID=30033 RepID=A0A6P4JQM0_DROKI|nr:trichohyalin [Drosophila kikkawai]